MTKLTWTGDQATATIWNAGNDGLYEAGEHVLEESNRVVPLEEGPLSQSGHVSADRDAGIVHVSYDTPYAARQHEELNYRHDEGREAKFLENTVNREAGTINAHIARKIREAM